jgi:hypothetical protein
MTEANAIAAINAVANISYGSSTTQCSDTVPAGDVISQSITGTAPCGTVVNLVVSTGQCAKDNFNDNRRGSMWQRQVDNHQITDVAEDTNRLNLTSGGGQNLAVSCVGHWKMNDNADNPTVADSSGHGNNGTAQQNTSALHTDSGNPPHLNGALTFNGTTDYINVGNVIGTGAYTKVAWVKRAADATSFNNIISSSSTAGNAAHALFAPYYYQYKLSAGHGEPYDTVQDSIGLEANRWYFVAVTYDPAVAGGKMILYKDGLEIDNATGVPAKTAVVPTYIGRFATVGPIHGSIDNVMIFNRALTADEISYLHNGGDGTELIPYGGGYGSAAYAANGWELDVSEDFQAKADFHYSVPGNGEGWVEMTLKGGGDDYVSLSAGFDGSQVYFYYEKAVDGNTVYGQTPRASNDGTLYISYDTSLDELYLSFTGYGSANAWQTISGLLKGQWASEPVRVVIGGGSELAKIEDGQAWLDNFEVTSGLLLGWPPVTDIDGNGFIDWDDLKIMCDNWLAVGPAVQGDIFEDEDNIVNFLDFAEFGLAW